MRLYFGDNQPVDCDCQLQPGWSQSLTSDLPSEFAVRDYWWIPYFHPDDVFRVLPPVLRLCMIFNRLCEAERPPSWTVRWSRPKKFNHCDAIESWLPLSRQTTSPLFAFSSSCNGYCDYSRKHNHENGSCARETNSSFGVLHRSESSWCWASLC